MKKKINPSDKVVIVEEELDGIGNVVGLSRLMFINEECGNLQVVVDDGELTRNNDGEKSQGLQTYRCQICDKCYRRD